MALIYFLFLIESSDCLVCHEDVKVSQPHNKINCIECHKGIKDLPHDVPLLSVNCLNCHSKIKTSFSLDFHFRARKKGNEKAPDCKKCHGKHELRIFKKDNITSIRKLCNGCHQNVRYVYPYHLNRYSGKKCLECHDEEIKKKLDLSVHKDKECMDCHRTLYSLEPEDEKHVEKIDCENCGMCHKSEFKEHEKSIHGEGIKEEKPAAKCYDCHGTHDIFKTSDKRSKVHYSNLPETCGKCHSDTKFAEKWGIPIKNPYELYEQSIHHKLIKQGRRAATCSDCHGIHDIRPHREAQAYINKLNVPKTCSKCHEKEYGEYVKSVHFKSLKNGNTDSPSCTDCHSEHRILPPWDPLSPVYPLNVPKTCADCHESVKLVQRYGMPKMALKTYTRSYHGVALKAGNLEAANCASCHGNHKILPSSDPESPINKNNLPRTCGKCHPAAKSGKIGSVHVRIDKTVKNIKKIVSIIYILLIIVTIGGMIVYCFLDYLKKIKEISNKKIKEIKFEIKENSKFSRAERVMHFIHLVSFFVLVYTGFAHRYPDNILFSFFVKIQDGLLRGYLHRIAGVLITLVFLVMFFLMVFTRKGRKKFKGLLFNLKDVEDAINLFLYNIGVKKERPELNHPFTFYEKFEFWALVWGTFLMGITGFLLWFRNFSLAFIPNWVLDVFLLLHFYEAILATLAILIWHLYWVIFDPFVHPINMSIFSDKEVTKVFVE